MTPKGATQTRWLSDMYTALYLLCTETDLISRPDRANKEGFIDIADIFSQIYTDAATGYGPWTAKRLSDEWSGRWIDRKASVWRVLVMKTSGNFSAAEMRARNDVRREIASAAQALGVALGAGAMAGDDSLGGGIVPPWPKDRKGVVSLPKAKALQQWNLGMGEGGNFPYTGPMPAAAPAMSHATAQEDAEDDEEAVEGEEDDEEDVNDGSGLERKSDLDADGSDVDDNDPINWPRPSSAANAFT